MNIDEIVNFFILDGFETEDLPDGGWLLVREVDKKPLAKIYLVVEPIEENLKDIPA